MTAHASVGTLDYCCGAKDVGDFSGDCSDYEAGTPQEMLTGLFNDNRGFTLQFWFVRVKDYTGKFRETFENDDIRQVIKSLPQAMCIAEEYINPNSGNKIEGWIVNNTKGDVKV